MGFLDNTSITVDAILTYRGRQILSQGGTLAISKFALSDEEIDYTLYDVTHPNGTDSYGSVIENMNLLEAIPNRSTFRSHLTDANLSGASLSLTLDYPNVPHGQEIVIAPTPQGGAPTENYDYLISDTGVIYFTTAPSSPYLTQKLVTVKAKSINPGASATVTVTGVQSGLSAIVNIHVATHSSSSENKNTNQ